MGLYEKIHEDAGMVGVDLSAEELAALMQENNASEETIAAVAKVFEHLRKKNGMRRSACILKQVVFR